MSQLINKSEIIEHVFLGLERTESIFQYIALMQDSVFPLDAGERQKLEYAADGIREECSKIIRGIGGITVKHAVYPDRIVPITVTGVTKYNAGKWHFPYRSGNQDATDPLEKPTNWLRSAYASLSSGAIRK